MTSFGVGQKHFNVVIYKPRSFFRMHGIENQEADLFQKSHNCVKAILKSPFEITINPKKKQCEGTVD